MRIDINQLLQQAITAHQVGKLEEAEILYRKILRLNNCLVTPHI